MSCSTVTGKMIFLIDDVLAMRQRVRDRSGSPDRREDYSEEPDGSSAAESGTDAGTPKTPINAKRPSTLRSKRSM